MEKSPPYVRYERNRHEDPQGIGADLIAGLMSQGIEVFVMETHPDEVHGGCSIVRYYPKGRHDSQVLTYEGPTAINFFLNKVLPRIKAH